MAYDETGNKIYSIKGYFLEPETNYNKAKVKNSDTSIAQGELHKTFQELLADRAFKC